MDKNFTQSHPIDNSALIHLAVHNTWHSNCFRLIAHLKNFIQPAKLQKAVDAIAPQFPMLIAGIRQKGRSFMVIPQTEHLYIRWDNEALVYMSMEEIHDCALRVLYGPRHIAIEVFHSLTDGTGALQFLKALLAEYLGTAAEPVSLDAAWEDSYQTHAGEKPTSMPGGASYLLPAASEDEQKIYQTTLNFSVKELLAVTRAEHTTITAFFTALFAQTAMKQQQYEKKHPAKPCFRCRSWFPSICANSLQAILCAIFPCMRYQSCPRKLPMLRFQKLCKAWQFKFRHRAQNPGCAPPLQPMLR